ncbi:ThuA domain-containing protein [Allonocardiopsis opalescens]|uniref:Trehalose utilization protein n=1 Tax=Allonocardiopsis opalescens TaxID=1144618 RepID=A0A2T0QEF1_9ACTN|nr:ThuA domain-containing protein [Allonocardiopsis opalescens]PRY02260.1 trehalose utilization protein [Allonocardiopsis opalescens]
MTRILVFSKTAGYRHDSIPAGVAAIAELAARAGLEAVATEDAAAFTAGELAHHRAVVFLSNTGEVLDDDQRAALRAFVDAGGGFAGVHAASNAEPDWPFFGELVGARFDRHPELQPATVAVADAGHPATAHLGPAWTLTDEWYDFLDDPTPRVRMLLTADEAGYTGARMGLGAAHPVAWCHQVGAANAFYTSLGHTEEVYADDAFRAHLIGGITWAARV